MIAAKMRRLPRRRTWPERGLSKHSRLRQRMPLCLWSLPADAHATYGSRPRENAQEESRTALGGAEFSKMAVFEGFFLSEELWASLMPAKGFACLLWVAKSARLRHSGGDRRHQRLDADDIHHPREIVGEHMQRHFAGHLRQRFHEKVRCSHARLQRPEGVLGGLTPHAHGFRVLVKPPLHGLRDMFVLPARDAALLALGALRLHSAALTCVRPEAAQSQSPLNGREVVFEMLPSRTTIDILAGDIDKVLFAEPAF